MYSAPSQEPVLAMVSTIGPWAAQPRVLTTACSSGSFATPSLAIYYPIFVPTTCVVRRLWWANGSTVSASYNVDCGVYADAGYKPGTRLVSTGSTAQGTASQVQFVDVTDTTLAPGRYWLALTSSSASATFFQIGASSNYDALFRFSESSALPLPATATPAESANPHYVCGFATTASP